MQSPGKKTKGGYFRMGDHTFPCIFAISVALLLLLLGEELTERTFSVLETTSKSVPKEEDGD